MHAPAEMIPDHEIAGSGGSEFTPELEVEPVVPSIEAANREFAALDRIAQEDEAKEAIERETKEATDDQEFADEWNRTSPDKYFTDKNLEKLDEHFHPVHKKF